MRAFLKNNRQTPRKVRLIARTVVGVRVDVALAQLSHMPHKAAKALKTLIASAYANAKQEDEQVNMKDLEVKNITVDKGMTHVRYMPRAFGRASPIRRESSHVRVTLGLHEPKSKRVKATSLPKEEKPAKEAVPEEEQEVIADKK